jgi:integrase
MFKRSKDNKMATVKFRIRSNANKNVTISVYLSTGRGKMIESKTGFTINPKDWSESTNRPIPSNTKKRPTGDEELGIMFDNHQEFKQKLHEDLDKLYSYIFKEQNKDLGKGVLIDNHWLDTKIIDCFQRVEKNDNSLLVNHIQYIIDNANTRKVRGRKDIGLSESTIKNYNLFKNIIIEYQNKIKTQIRFIEITKPFVDKFTDWLVNTKKYSTNYSGKQLEILKTVCIDAEKTEIQVTPYSKIIQHYREAEENRYIQTLSFEELEQIRLADFNNVEQLKEFKKENPQLTKNLSLTPEALNNARNWILIGCEIGQRGGDLLKIKKEDIRYKDKSCYIDIIQEKTKKSVTVGIIAPKIVEIIENNLPKKIQHQKFNEYAKVVCKLAGIDNIIKGTKLNNEINRKELGMFPKYELITSHCFRRSFATNYYKKIPTAVLMSITGHSKESLFLSYINQREDKDANADLFMKLLKELNKDQSI